MVVMIATADADADVASSLAEECFERGIVTAGLILGEGADVAAAVSALRPYARNLMVTDDEEDVAEVLRALRDDGATPPGVDPAHHRVRSAAIVLPQEEAFIESCRDALAARAGVAHTSV